MNAKTALLALPLLLAASPVSAKGLTVHMGETWVFAIDRGQPARARKVVLSNRRGWSKRRLMQLLG